MCGGVGIEQEPHTCVRMCSSECMRSCACIFEVGKWQQVKNDGQTAGNFKLEKDCQTTFLIAWSQLS